YCSIRNRTEKFQHPAPGASANEITIALYAIEQKNFSIQLRELYRTEKFQHPAPGVSANEMTIALYAIEQKNFSIQLRELQQMK
uniref:hypothetical protein n=1 Tax=Okeania sp. SIO2F4 TaxID=2607790 RepID=UPI0025FCA18D